MEFCSMSQRQNVVFKSYITNQPFLLPPSLDELISANHPVRAVNSVIDELNIDHLLKSYKGGGTSSYHPRMLLKVMIYSYLCNVYSSRKMEQCLKENIHFMWLSGMQQPDHNTLNRYRSERLEKVLKPIFAQVVEFLSQKGQVSLKEVYTDGTKIEANANRYTFVWGNSIKYNKGKMTAQLQELWSYTQEIAKEELKDNSEVHFSSISAEEVKEQVEKIHEVLKKKPISHLK